MQHTLNIRHATPHDAELLATFGAQAFYDAFATQNSVEDMADYLKTAFTPAVLARELADSHATFLMAELNGTLVGYAKLQQGTAPTCITGAKPMELARLYSAQSYVGKGIGSSLMAYALQHAQQLGYETIWLGVWEHNHRAQKFYRKWNFQPVGSHIFWVGKDPQQDLLMQRTIL